MDDRAVVKVIGRPIHLNGKQYLDLENLDPKGLKDYLEDPLFSDCLDGQFCIQVTYPDGDSKIYTSNGYYPCFLDVRGNKICSAIDFDFIDGDFVEMYRKYSNPNNFSLFSDEIVSSARKLWGNHISTEFLGLGERNVLNTMSRHHKLLLPHSLYTLTGGFVTREDLDPWITGINDEPDEIIDRFFPLPDGNDRVLVIATSLVGLLILTMAANLEKHKTTSIYFGEMPERALWIPTRLSDFGNEVIIVDQFKCDQDELLMVKNHIAMTNGFGDPYRLFYYFWLVIEKFKEFDHIVSDAGWEVFLDEKISKYSLSSMIASTGVGHYFKYMAQRARVFAPFLDREFISAAKDIKREKNFLDYVLKSYDVKVDNKMRQMLTTIYPPRTSWDFNTRKEYIDDLYKEASKNWFES